MRATRVVRTMLVVGVLLLAVAPSAAFAVTRTVTRVTGAEMAAEAMSQFKGVDVGAQGATVTVSVDGRATEIPIDFGEAVSAVERGEGPGWLKVAILPLVGGAMLRVLAFLAKLGRG
jgi:NAD/NADP transhydrogenase alpha subunit